MEPLEPPISAEPALPFLPAIVEIPMNPITSLTEALPMPEGQRAALTLLDLKNETKIVLVAIPGGTQVPEHKVAYPASVLLLSGSVEVMREASWTRISPGESLPLEPEILHAVRATVASYVLVTQLRGLGSKGKTNL